MESHPHFFVFHPKDDEAGQYVWNNRGMSNNEPAITADESTHSHSYESAQTQDALRDISEVAATEVIVTAAVHLMSAAAVKCGLADTPDAEELTDLDEARKLITALAALVVTSAPDIGNQHARSLRDGLRSLQLAFREASAIPDAPGEGPGEKFTGYVS